MVSAKKGDYPDYPVMFHSLSTSFDLAVAGTCQTWALCDNLGKRTFVRIDIGGASSLFELMFGWRLMGLKPQKMKICPDPQRPAMLSIQKKDNPKAEDATTIQNTKI